VFLLGNRSIDDGSDGAVVAQLATLCVYRAVDVGVCDVCVTELCDSVVGSFADTVVGAMLACMFHFVRSHLGIYVRVVNEAVFQLQSKVVHAFVCILLEVPSHGAVSTRDLRTR
jgi:hypothetical protein